MADSNRLAQAQELEALQTLERAELADRASYAAMTPEQRRQFAEHLISHAASHGGADGAINPKDYKPPAGPAAWLIKTRMEAGGPSPWHEDQEFLARATSRTGRSWVAGKMRDKYADLGELQETFTALDADYSRRGEAAEVKGKLDALQAEVTRLETMGDVQLYAYLQDHADHEAVGAVQRVQDDLATED